MHLWSGWGWPPRSRWRSPSKTIRHLKSRLLTFHNHLVLPESRDCCLQDFLNSHPSYPLSRVSPHLLPSPQDLLDFCSQHDIFPQTSPPSRPRFNFSFDSVVQNLSGLPLLNTMNTWSEGNWCCFGGWLIKLLLTFRFLIDFYTLRHPVTCEILSTIIWGVPPACLGSR